ncbi:MAG: cadherin-like domain-containing protein, partial [Clostridiaceae bacterium]|nr:cadherin-like domain-containing protein [Clostridiaceae bacterium]
GTFTYTPASGFSGTDTFTYTIEDADGETSTATVTITVTAAPTPTPTPSGVLGDTPEPVDAPSIHITAVPNKTVVVYGETVDYVLYITNNGNTDLENVTVSDAVLGISDYVVGDLRIGETRVLRSSDIPQLSYVVLPTVAVPVLTDSVVNGIPTNGASAVTSRDDTRVDIINIVITVTSDKTTISKGDSVTLTYRVTNEGTTDMTNVVLSDPNIGIVNYPIGSLRVGESVTVTSTVARGSVFVPPASSGSSVSSTPSATGSVATEGVTVTSTSSTNLIITIRTTSGTDIVKTGESNDVLIRIVSVALMAIGTLTIVGVLRKKRLS